MQIQTLLYNILVESSRTLVRSLLRKRSNRRNWLFALCLLLLLFRAVPTLWYHFISILDYPIHYKEYKEFGIKIPSGYDLHGIDVSRWQERVDWGKVKGMQVGDVKLDFVFMKATQGTSYRDPQFRRNWEAAKQAGMIRGAYHYFEPKYSPQDQAKNLFRTLKLSKGDLPPVVDVEKDMGMTPDQVRRYTKYFLVTLEKYYKVKPILYTYSNFYEKYFENHPDFEDYPLWIAHYNVANPVVSDGRDWHFWQHSDRGQVHGINPRVDFNVFDGDLEDLKKLCIP